MVKRSEKQQFPFTIIAVLSLFFFALIASTLFAYSRRSGNTGLDMAKVQQFRMKKAAEQLNSQETLIGTKD